MKYILNYIIIGLLGLLSIRILCYLILLMGSIKYNYDVPAIENIFNVF